MGELGELLDLGEVLLKGQGRKVIHDRGETRADAAQDEGEIRTVVDMDADGNLCLLGILDHQRADDLDLDAGLIVDLGMVDDDGDVDLFRCRKNTTQSLKVGGVDTADGVSTVLRIPKHLPHIHKHMKLPSSG